MIPLIAETKEKLIIISCFIDVPFFNVATETFKMTYVASIVFPLNSVVLALWMP